MEAIKKRTFKNELVYTTSNTKLKGASLMLNFVVRFTQFLTMGFLVCSLAFGQGVTGSLAGTVLDANSAVIAGATVEAHQDETGVYPESVGISIWGTSAMRTHGDDVAEVLALLGVTPVWQKENRRLVGVEVMPLAELGRQLDGKPFIGMHYAGPTKQIFLAPVPVQEGLLLLLAVFDEESSLGLVQLFFKDFSTAVRKVAPVLNSADAALAKDFEGELNKNLAAMFGRG